MRLKAVAGLYGWRWFSSVLLAGLFILLLYRFDLIESALSPWLRGRSNLVNRASLPQLAVQHIFMVGLSSGLSLVMGLGAGIAVSSGRGRQLRSLMLDLVSVAETLPSAAVIALAVPLIGYGYWPTVLALVLYGTLPILRNTLIGLEHTDPALLEAAVGMGMKPLQVFFRVRLPLAFPAIIYGFRTSLIINTSAATLGAAVGAGGFGVPIVSGLRAMDTITILRGALPVTVLALLLDSLVVSLQQAGVRRLGG